MTQLATKITSATVYPDRALLTRRGTLSLEAGAHSLEITELPLYLKTDFSMPQPVERRVHVC